MKAAAPAAALSRHQIASWGLTGIALLAVLQLHLLPALLAGLLVFQLVHSLSGALRIPYLTSRNAKLLFVALLAVIVVALLVLAGIGIVIFLRRGPDNLALLLTQLAAIVEDLRRLLPAGIVEHLPSENRDVRPDRRLVPRISPPSQARSAPTRCAPLCTSLIGLIPGGMIALYEVTRTCGDRRSCPPCRRAPRCSPAPSGASCSQLPISAINTTLTALYLLAVLPAFGVHLPFAKTLIAVTFFGRPAAGGGQPGLEHRHLPGQP